MSTRMVSGLAKAAMPPSPSATARTDLASGNIVTMISVVPRSASCRNGVAPISPPTVAARRVSESNTDNSCPAFTMFAAIGFPMVPTPINATFIG
jgi:hypothetical protein